LTAAVLLLCLAALAWPTAAGTPAEEARLYVLSDLDQVDLSPKTVQVEIYVAPASELQPFVEVFPLVWAEVQNFYARLGVNLVRLQGQAQPRPLAPAERLRLEVLTQKEWLNRSFQAFNVPSPFRPSFLAVCRNKYAFAHLPLSVIHFSFARFREELFRPEPGAAPLNRHLLANLLIHELGHLLGLYHAHEFTDDPIEELLPDRKTPNFMSHYLMHAGSLGFVPLQKQIIHSYLSKGKVFEQYRRVDFDPMRYLELIKKYNGFKEPAKAKETDEAE
jgi:hypothetical protein